MTPCCQESSGIYELETKALGGGSFVLSPTAELFGDRRDREKGRRSGCRPPELRRFKGVGRGVFFTLG